MASRGAFFFKETATTEIYTLSLHDALPIYAPRCRRRRNGRRPAARSATDRRADGDRRVDDRDRKSTRLNSSHVEISYAVFCLKKKKITKTIFYQNNKKKNTKNSK